MNIIRNSYPRITSAILFCICVLFVLQSTITFAQEDSSITLCGQNIEISYHQPFINSYKSKHPSYIEIPKINHILNLFQNYIHYLKKLGRLNGHPSIKINYTPDALLEDIESKTSRLITINDLGLNNILQKVNSYLSEYEFAQEGDLIATADGLENLPDNDIKTPEKFSSIPIFTNHSLTLPSNEPDTAFAVIDNTTVVTTRPGKKTNLICKLSLNKPEESTVYSQEAETWYREMYPSDDGKYLAVTDGLKPMIVNFPNKEFKELFPNRSDITSLYYDWAPSRNLLAGMILDESTSERYIYIYDPEKGGMLDFGNFSKKLKANHIHANPFWSPDGSRVAFLSARAVNIININQNSAKADIVTFENEISELLWSNDSNSFAVLEVKGQPRNQYIFDDLDYRGTKLHRFNLDSTGLIATEDLSQLVESRVTMKLVSFTDTNQILYLEGHLESPEIPSAFWDLSKSFKAYLTPVPNSNIEKNNHKRHKNSSRSKCQQLPMQYLFVYRSLDSKNQNIYDSGNGHCNLLYADDYYSNWCLGLYSLGMTNTNDYVYNVRLSPYPFQEQNYTFLLNAPTDRVKQYIKFLQDYNIRATNSSPDGTRFFMLTNFNGILNVWSADANQILEWAAENYRADPNNAKNSHKNRMNSVKPISSKENDEDDVLEDSNPNTDDIEGNKDSSDKESESSEDPEKADDGEE